MPRNANTGIYTPPSNSWNPAVPDTVISSADWNALRNDLSTALNHSPSTTRALHPTTGQVQDGAFVWGGTAGGTADALTLNLTPPITSYVTGLTVRFRVGSTSNATTTPTLSVNGLAAHTIKRYDGTPLAAGDLVADSIAEVVHDGSAWRLLMTAKSQTQGNNGSTSATSSTNIILNETSSRAQLISVATEGGSVFLPNAKTLSIGGPLFYIKNVGIKTFALRTSNDNQVNNGGFNNSSGWVLGTGWTISGGVATKTAGSAADIEQAVATESGVSYRVTFTITSVSGGAVRAVLKGGGPDVLGPLRTAPGTYTETLVSTGNTHVALRADAAFNGSVDNVELKHRYAPLLAGMPPGAIAECILEDNSTVQGKWHIIGQNTTPAVTILNANLASSMTNISFFRSLKLSDTLSLHFARSNTPSNQYVFAVDHGSDPPTVGTAVTIGSASSDVHQAFRLSDDKAFVVIPGGNCRIVSVSSGTTCTVSSGASAPVLGFWDAPHTGTHIARPLIARLGDNNDLFVGIDVSSGFIRAQAVDASGTAPVAGPIVNVSSSIPSTNSFNAVSIFRVDNNRAVAFYIDDSGNPGSPFSIRAAVLTLTGTSITVGTSDGINDIINDTTNSHGVVCQLTNELYVWVYRQFLSEVRAVAITVSGTTVTFGTPVLIATTSGNFKVTFDLGTRYNPVIFKISENRVFASFLQTGTSEFRCAILTVNGLTVSSGPIFSLNYQTSPLFFPYNNEHTVMALRNLNVSGPQPATGGLIGLDHTNTSIVVSGAVSSLGTPFGGTTSDVSSITFKLSNGIIGIRYDVSGMVLGSTVYRSARVELFAPSPNGTPKSLGYFTIPEIDWVDARWPVEISDRRIAFMGRSVLQEGNNSGDNWQLKLFIMEIASQ